MRRVARLLVSASLCLVTACASAATEQLVITRAVAAAPAPESATFASPGAPVAPPPVSPPDPPPAPALAQPPAPRVVVTADQITITEQILFDTDKATIAATSASLVQEVAATIVTHPEVDFVEIAGHADKRGDATANLTLTQQRADAVMKALVAAGADPRRLRAVGYGAYCPLDPGDDDAAYAKNRRVEFRILRRSGVDLPTRWGGCAGAESRGMRPAPVPLTAPRSAPTAGDR